MSATQEAPGREITAHAAPDLDYVYRDFFTVFAGPEEVVVEFGNVHRGTPNQAAIGNRIVLSSKNAERLAEVLARALTEMRRRQAAAAQHPAQ